MKKWYLIIDVEKCENCNNCFLACKDEHVDNDWPGYALPQPGQGQTWIEIHRKERGAYPLIDVAYLPVPCMHCDDAPCIKAAKEGAVYKRPDGIVIIDPVKAKGQEPLVKACPYDAIQWNEGLDVPQKCTLCAHLLDEGWKQTRCVQACPTGALRLLHMEDAEVQEIIKAEKLEAYQPERKTSPRVYYRNLYRFTRCFIGGSVAVRVNNKDECAEGATVTLLNSSSAKVGECLTDSFGDFKLDNLEENSGTYTLRMAYTGYDTKTIAVELTKSVNVGTIFLLNGDA
jgi:Fe-S-cluster-containing dehydrogenase component